MKSPAQAILVRLAVLLAAAGVLGGCAGRYFHDAGPPPAVPAYTLASLPYKEYWTGIIFNGAKVGFGRFHLQALPQQGLYEMQSEAVIRLRFLGLDKSIRLASREVVREDLTLVRFRHDHHLDGSDLKLDGEVEGRALLLRIESGGSTTEKRMVLEEPLYPASAVVLYPALAGLRPGCEHRFVIFSSDLQRPVEIEQRVEGYERSAVFDGAAFKVATNLLGLKMTTWIDAQARPVFELGLSGVLISALEPEDKAKSYLAAAALNKDDMIVGWSLIRAAPPIARARQTSYLKVEVSGPEGRRPPVNDARQHCAADSGTWTCEISRDRSTPAGTAEAKRYLEPTLAAPSIDSAIAALAKILSAGSASSAATIDSILQWISANIRKEPADVFSARDVLDRRRAECQGHAYLFAALARASGIATRVANGIVYSEDHGGFLYHTWVESLVEGRWRAIDPTFAQAHADATHIALVYGENMEDLLPILDWVGKTRVRVLEVRG